MNWHVLSQLLVLIVDERIEATGNCTSSFKNLDLIRWLTLLDKYEANAYLPQEYSKPLTKQIPPMLHHQLLESNFSTLLNIQSFNTTSYINIISKSNILS